MSSHFGGSNDKFDSRYILNDLVDEQTRMALEACSQAHLQYRPSKRVAGDTTTSSGALRAGSHSAYYSGSAAHPAMPQTVLTRPTPSSTDRQPVQTDHAAYQLGPAGYNPEQLNLQAPTKELEIVFYDPYADGTEGETSDEESEASDAEEPDRKLRKITVSIPGRADFERIACQAPELAGAPRMHVRLTVWVGVLEVLILCPHYTKRPLFLLRLLSNGWTYGMIAAVRLWARGELDKNTLRRHTAAIRQQALAIGPEEFPETAKWSPTRNKADLKPVINYCARGYILRSNVTEPEEDATLASLAEGVVKLNYLGVEDSGRLMQAVREAKAVGDTTSKISDIPALSATYGWRMPPSALANPRWDQEVKTRIVDMMTKDGVAKLPKA